MSVVTGSVGVWCGAVATVASVGWKDGEGPWWQGSVSLFAMVVRLVDREVAVGEYEPGTGSRGMASPTVAFACSNFDVSTTWANAMGDLEGRRNSGSRAPECECELSGGGENVFGAAGISRVIGRGNGEEAWLLGLVSTSAMVCAEWGDVFARLSGGDEMVDVLVLTGLRESSSLLGAGWLCVVVACCQAANLASTVCSQETMLAISCFSA